MQSKREWPWGLVVLGDPQDREQFPATLEADQVARTVRSVVAGIQHAVDGPATASVSVDEQAPALTLVHTGDLRLDGGRLRLADAADGDLQEREVTPGVYEVQVLVDEVVHPTRVHFALQRKHPVPPSAGHRQ